MCDLFIFGGKIVTLDGDKPFADAMIVKNGLISHLGSYNDLRQLGKSAKRTLKMETPWLLIPGFHESHAHLLSLGSSLISLNLNSAQNSDEIVETVKQKSLLEKEGEWIIGRGWDQNKWQDKNFPDHHLLTSGTLRHPVFLKRIDGHAAWVNKLALEIAQINKNTLDPKGGKIIRDNLGEPTGLLIDEAMTLVSKHIPKDSPAIISKKIIRATQECHSFGITSFHDAGTEREAIPICWELASEGRSLLRLYLMLDGTDKSLVDDYLRSGPEINLFSDCLSIRAIKLFADGALGSRGAALTKGYKETPQEKGLLLLTEDEIAVLTEKAIRQGFQVAVHAIGDQANHVTINAFQTAISRSQKKSVDLRLRLEHAQILKPEDITRLKELNIIASMQPIHCTSDMKWIEDVVNSELLISAYAWQDLFRAGVTLAFGSDAPVESLSPLRGFHAAITRQDHTDFPKGGWQPRQKMERLPALTAYTKGAAFSSFAEKKTGSLSVGKYADFVILSQDILTVPEKEILNTKVLLTAINGKFVFNKVD